MSWPLSPNFYKLISKTADRGKSQYTLPHGGLLAVDRTLLLARAGEECEGGLGRRGARPGASRRAAPPRPRT